MMRRVLHATGLLAALAVGVLVGLVLNHDSVRPPRSTSDDAPLPVPGQQVSLVNKCGEIISHDGGPITVDIPLAPAAADNPAGAEQPLGGVDVDGGSRAVALRPPLEGLYSHCVDAKVN